MGIAPFTSRGRRGNSIGQAEAANQTCVAWLFDPDSYNTTKFVLAQGKLGRFSTKVLDKAIIRTDTDQKQKNQ